MIVMVRIMLWKFPQHSASSIIPIAFTSTDPTRILAKAGRRRGRMAKPANRLVVSTSASPNIDQLFTFDICVCMESAVLLKPRF